MVGRHRLLRLAADRDGLADQLGDPRVLGPIDRLGDDLDVGLRRAVRCADGRVELEEPLTPVPGPALPSFPVVPSKATWPHFRIVLSGASGVAVVRFESLRSTSVRRAPFQNRPLGKAAMLHTVVGKGPTRGRRRRSRRVHARRRSRTPLQLRRRSIHRTVVRVANATSRPPDPSAPR